jgi:hypothetical protein
VLYNVCAAFFVQMNYRQSQKKNHKCRYVNSKNKILAEELVETNEVPFGEKTIKAKPNLDALLMLLSLKENL